jgi:hypothetical protein
MARVFCRWVSRCGVTAAFVAAAVLANACAPKRAVSPPPAAPLAPAAPREPEDVAERLGRELESSRAELVRLQQQLEAAQRRAAVAEEQHEALRREMDRALDDLLASKASSHGMRNRALAISRIAEVRVQLRGVGRRDEPEVAGRLRRAESLLARADRTLEEGNYGGAVYLADRAGDLVQHARTVAEVAAQQTSEGAGLIPIVPPRTIEVVVGANLRQGPDTAQERVGAAQAGTRLVAVARRGDWFEVETTEGRTAWIHRATVR